MTENNSSAKKIIVKNPAVSTKLAITKIEKKPKKEKKSEDKIKVVRDSFTMPQEDYELITTIKQKALQFGLHVKKSELLRAGLHVLSKLNNTQLKQTMTSLEKIKTCRPKKT